MTPLPAAWFAYACAMNPWMLYWGAMTRAWCPERATRGNETAAPGDEDLPAAHRGDGPALPL